LEEQHSTARLVRLAEGDLMDEMDALGGEDGRPQSGPSGSRFGEGGEDQDQHHGQKIRTVRPNKYSTKYFPTSPIT